MKYGFEGRGYFCAFTCLNVKPTMNLFSRNRQQVPLTMAYCADHHTLVTASADMTLLQWYLDDIPAIKHYTLKSRWPTKHAAMSMCWSSSHRLLYSGTTAGTIQGTIVTRCEADFA